MRLCGIPLLKPRICAGLRTPLETRYFLVPQTRMNTAFEKCQTLETRIFHVSRDFKPVNPRGYVSRKKIKKNLF